MGGSGLFDDGIESGGVGESGEERCTSLCERSCYGCLLSVDYVLFVDVEALENVQIAANIDINSTSPFKISRPSASLPPPLPTSFATSTFAAPLATLIRLLYSSQSNRVVKTTGRLITSVAKIQVLIPAVYNILNIHAAPFATSIYLPDPSRALGQSERPLALSLPCRRLIFLQLLYSALLCLTSPLRHHLASYNPFTAAGIAQ